MCQDVLCDGKLLAASSLSASVANYCFTKIEEDRWFKVTSFSIFSQLFVDVCVCKCACVRARFTIN